MISHKYGNLLKDVQHCEEGENTHQNLKKNQTDLTLAKLHYNFKHSDSGKEDTNF